MGRHDGHKIEKRHLIGHLGEVPDVPLQVGVHIGAVIGLPVHGGVSVERRHGASEDPRIDLIETALPDSTQPGHQPLRVCGVGDALIAAQLRVREAQQADDPHTARQALADILHQPEHLGAGEPEVPLAVGAVHTHFDVRQQLRGILDLVDQHRRRIALHEQGGVLLGKIAHIRIVQRHILPVRPHQLLQQRGLSNLPGACHQQDREHLGQLPHGRLCGSCDIHVGASFLTNQKYSFIIVGLYLKVNKIRLF